MNPIRDLKENVYVTYIKDGLTFTFCKGGSILGNNKMIALVKETNEPESFKECRELISSLDIVTRTQLGLYLDLIAEASNREGGFNDGYFGAGLEYGKEEKTLSLKLFFSEDPLNIYFVKNISLPIEEVLDNSVYNAMVNILCSSPIGLEDLEAFEKDDKDFKTICDNYLEDGNASPESCAILLMTVLKHIDSKITITKEEL